MMKRFKMRCLSVLLSLFILVNTTFIPTFEVEAAEVLTMTALEAFLSLFGLELGLGSQSDFFSNSYFADFVDAVINGETVTMEPYGEVNFSDADSIFAFMVWASALSYSASDSNVLACAKLLDSASYRNTGTSATDSMDNVIDSLVSSYDGDTSSLVEDVKDAFSVVKGSSDDAYMTTTRWDIFKGMMSAFFYGTAEKITGFVDTITTPNETVYQGYSAAFDSAVGFDPDCSLPKYSNSADPQYSTYEDYYVCGYANIDGDLCSLLIPPSCMSDSYFSFVVMSGSSYLFYTMNLSTLSVSYLSVMGAWYSSTGHFLHQSWAGNSGWTDELIESVSLPVFSSLANAQTYVQTGDASNILNLVDTSAYPTFKDEVSSSVDIADMIASMIDAIPSVDEYVSILPDLLDVAGGVAGTAEAILAVTAAIAELAGISQAQDNANSLSIIKAIQQQTSDLLAGIQSAILAALAAATVPDFDYWEKELDARIATLEASASILVFPLTIITLLFGVVVDSDGVGDFILTLPPIEYKGYTLYEGCTFNFNDFVEQSHFTELHNLFIVITDAMVVFWIANYAMKKFNSIIGGR